jgi:HEAT repeat protein
MMSFRKSLLIGLLVSVSFGSLSAFAAEYRAADVEECIQKLYSNDQGDRASAGERLSEMGAEGKAAIPRLIEILDADPVMSVRGEAAKALGNIGKVASSSTPTLIAFLKNKDGGIERAYAATALGNIAAQPTESIAALIEVIQTDGDEPTVRELSARALGDFGAQASSAVPVLITCIKKGSKEMRDAAASSLAKIPATSRDVPALTEMLSDEVTVARCAAAKALSGAGSEAAGAVPTLTKMLADPNAEVRTVAITTLGSIGKDAKSAIPLLRAAGKDPTLKSATDEAIANIKAAK